MADFDLPRGRADPSRHLWTIGEVLSRAFLPDEASPFIDLLTAIDEADARRVVREQT